MSVIWKFPITVDHHQKIEMPRNAKILSVQMQGDTPVIWAVCEPLEPKVIRNILVVLTGQMFSYSSNNDQYVGTCQYRGFVFHVFIEPWEAPIKT